MPEPTAFDWLAPIKSRSTTTGSTIVADRALRSDIRPFISVASRLISSSPGERAPLPRIAGRVTASTPWSCTASGDWAGINVSGAAVLTNNTSISFDDGLTVAGPLQFANGAMRDIEKNAIVVSGSAVSVTSVAFSRIGLDAIDSTSSVSTDTITDNQ